MTVRKCFHLTLRSFLLSKKRHYWSVCHFFQNPKLNLNYFSESSLNSKNDTFVGGMKSQSSLPYVTPGCVFVYKTNSSHFLGYQYNGAPPPRNVLAWHFWWQFDYFLVVWDWTNFLLLWNWPANSIFKFNAWLVLALLSSKFKKMIKKQCWGQAGTTYVL